MSSNKTNDTRTTERKQLFNMLQRSVDAVYTNFSKVIQVKGLEQCVVALIYAHLFQKIQFSEYKDLDLNSEYNKNCDSVKSTPNFSNGVRPDIILHKMWSNDENKIAIEFKGWWNNDDEKDIQKLKDLTAQNGTYKYLLGVWVLLEKDAPSYKFVINGEERNSLDAE